MTIRVAQQAFQIVKLTQNSVTDHAMETNGLTKRHAAKMSFFVRRASSVGYAMFVRGLRISNDSRSGVVGGYIVYSRGARADIVYLNHKSGGQPIRTTKKSNVSTSTSKSATGTVLNCLTKD
jgi:hypothetical protein